MGSKYYYSIPLQSPRFLLPLGFVDDFALDSIWLVAVGGFHPLRAPTVADVN